MTDTQTPRWLDLPAPQPMPAPLSSGVMTLRGIEMYHAIYGPDVGLPVLMIHGGVGHADLWSAQVADLSRDHRVIVADTRGHGRSTNDGSDYEIPLLADDYIALLDALGVQKLALVGWSDGANIGLDLAARHPERIARVFAHAGNVTLEGIDPAVNESEVFGRYVTEMAGAYAAMSATPAGWDSFLGGVSGMWAAAKPDGLEKLREITVPVTIVQSQYDEGIRMSHAQEMAHALPNGTLVVLPDVSHFAMLQAPEDYSAAIRDFLSA